MKNLALIGTGNLGTAIIEGILKDKSLNPSNIYATRNHIEKIGHLAEKGVNTLNNNVLAAKKSDVILLCVKPYKVREVLTELKPVLTPEKLVISVATGISIADMEAVTGKEQVLFRAMPNTAASVEEAITCICGNSENEDNKREVSQIFDHIGKTVFISEELMDAATVIGACGIAYVLRFIRAMIQGGIEIGFDAQTAATLVSQTVKGAAQLLIENGLHPEQEIDKVTTPKGCTIAGLNEMEHQGFSSSLIKGIKASYEKIGK
ncbi:MAG: pyrroline-5-carboxylate reductase [Flavobacteriaceae bacterium]|jgi:pyrroline-5-carboxylate reductase|nr:pyrroline-5-carboxylate reductase [Flavobacteriaceae bacterium]